MLCYKYMSYERFVQSIRPSGIYLKVSRPAEFNDPYDCTGVVHGTMSDRLRDKYRTVFRQFLSPEELDLSIKVESRRFSDGMYRILSLCDSEISGSPNEMLMWSHYAENAHGVRIGVDIDAERYKLSNVEYKESLPLLDLDKVVEWEIYDDTEMKRFLRECLLTKHIVWNYEREKRIVFRINDCSLKPFSIIDAEESISTATMMWTPEKPVLKEFCFGASFLQNGGRYEGTEKYLQTLIDAGYDFDVFCATQRKEYGYDIKPQMLSRNIDSSRA